MHRKNLHSDDFIHQLCTFIFTPNSTENAGTYWMVITASGASQNITNSFNITSHLGTNIKMFKLDNVIYFIRHLYICSSIYL